MLGYIVLVGFLSQSGHRPAAISAPRINASIIEYAKQGSVPKLSPARRAEVIDAAQLLQRQSSPGTSQYVAGVFVCAWYRINYARQSAALCTEFRDVSSSQAASDKLASGNLARHILGLEIPLMIGKLYLRNGDPRLLRSLLTTESDGSGSEEQSDMLYNIIRRRPRETLGIAARTPGAAHCLSELANAPDDAELLSEFRRHRNDPNSGVRLLVRRVLKRG